MKPQPQKDYVPLIRKPFRPLEPMAQFAIASLSLGLVFMFAYQAYFASSIVETMESNKPPEPSFLITILVMLSVTMIVMVLAHVLFAIWLWRAAQNLKTFDGRQRSSLDMVVTLACFIPPLTGILMPVYFSMLYKASQPGGEKPDDPLVPKFVLWRLLSMLGLFFLMMVAQVAVMVSQITKMADEAARFQDQAGPTVDTGDFWLVMFVFIGFVLGILWAWASMLWKITKMQQTRIENRPNSVPPDGDKSQL